MEDKNYYDLLEISKKASPEVIEKAYKALVKKYHPDLYEGDKLEAEEILKKINEAYDVLSDSSKRAEYDATLHEDNVSREDYDRLQQELKNLKSNHQDNVQSTYSISQQEIEHQRQMEAARQKAYHDAYIQDLRNRGYRIRYKKTFKDYVRIAITILVLVAIAWISWHIPFIRNWIVDSCNDNPYLKLILGIIFPID